MKPKSVTLKKSKAQFKLSKDGTQKIEHIPRASTKMNANVKRGNDDRWTMIDTKGCIYMISKGEKIDEWVLETVDVKKDI